MRHGNRQTLTLGRCDMVTLTGRLMLAVDELRELRAEVNDLALLLLDSDDGITEGQYVALAAVMNRLGGMPDLKVDVTDGRYYIPNRSM
jgi:hypothetical protein